MSTTIVVPTGDWIQTYTGRRFRPLDPDPKDVNIHDIAHSLSQLTRFTGHLRDFYSVAQHCVIVSQNVPAEDALWGLLHDATEAYMNDLSRPLKYDPRLAAFKELEKGLEKAVAEHFGLPLPEPASVKIADRRLLLTERRDLFVVQVGWLTDEKKHRDVDDQPFDFHIQPMLPREAERMYIERFKELTNGRFQQ